MYKLLKQRIGKVMQKANKLRIQIEDKILFKMGMTERYNMILDKENKKIIFIKKDDGKYKVTICNNGKRICIDRNNEQIRNILEGCSTVKYSFYMKDNIPMVLVEGIIKSAEIIKNELNKNSEITSFSICSGAGVSSYIEKKAGFKKVAFCEYNPSGGSESKYSDICENNFPDAVCLNVPLENLKASDIPYADVWSATLPCNDFSTLANWKTEFSSMHLYMYLMKLFWEKPMKERPKAIIFENVPNFEKVAGNSLELVLKNEGYYTTKGVLNSLDFRARTKRERFYLIASIFDGFSFPESTGRVTTPINSDGVITLNSLDWITPENSLTLKNFIRRSSDPNSKRHKIKTYDITKDSHIGTIIKNHAKLQPENIIKHPSDPNKYAFIMDIDHLKYLHGLDKNYDLGNSKRTAIESIGQGVCCKTFYAIAKKLYNFLKEKMFHLNKIKSNETEKMALNSGVQLEWTL